MIKIKLGEVDYNLTFNMGFLKMLYKDFAIDPLSIDWQKMSFIEMAALVEGIFCAGLNANLKQEKKELLPIEEVKNIAEQLHPNDMTAIITGFTTWMITPEETVVQPKKEVAEAATFQEI